MALIEISWEAAAERLVRNRERDYFNCVVITGMVRRGKSRLAYLLMQYVYPQFSYEINYIGNPKHNEAFDRLFDTPAKSASWLDEAAKVLATENRFSTEQSWLARLFEQFASHNKTIFLCTPSFIQIDPRWRRTHITVWLHVFARGKAVLLVKRDIQSSLDVWGLKGMEEKELAARADGLTDERILQNFDANPCAIAYFRFPDWDTKEQKDEYEKWKTKSQQDLRNEHTEWVKELSKKKELQRKEFALARIALVLMHRGMFAADEIARISGYKPTSIYRILDGFNGFVASNEEYANQLPPIYFTPDLIDLVREKAGLTKAKDSIK
jgi:hypothetical protein